MKKKVLIIGSGPAGSTAAIYCARAYMDTTMISGDQPGGQLTITTDVENYPGFVEAVNGSKLVNDMIKQAENVGTKVISGMVKSINVIKSGERNKFEVCYHVLDQVVTDIFDAIIICTGARAKSLGLASEQKYIGHGVSMCATCDGPFFRKKDVIVVGGGNSAVEEALFLSNMCNSVTIVHRRDAFRAEQIMVNRLSQRENVNILWNHELKEVLGGSKRLTGGLFENNIDKTEKLLNCHGIFVAIGHKPNTDFLRNLVALDEDGYVLVRQNKYETMTSVSGMFAAGDVCDKIYRQAVTAAGMGCMAALDVQKFLE